MARPRPQALLDEAPLVRRLGLEGRLLAVRYSLDGKAAGPDSEAHGSPQVPTRGCRTGHRHQCGQQRHEDPEPLEGPGHEEAGPVWLEGVEAAVLATAFDAQEQEAAQT